VKRPQDLERAFRIGDGRFKQRCLVRAALALGVSRSCVPGCRHDGLIVLDDAVLDFDPMPERTARSFE
jgi:hypothetical protein